MSATFWKASRKATAASTVVLQGEGHGAQCCCHPVDMGTLPAGCRWHRPDHSPELGVQLGGLRVEVLPDGVGALQEGKAVVRPRASGRAPMLPPWGGISDGSEHSPCPPPPSSFLICPVPVSVMPSSQGWRKQKGQGQVASAGEASQCHPSKTSSGVLSVRPSLCHCHEEEPSQ